MDYANLKVGMNIDIQRSDGRVHSACISGLNKNTQSVTVEWFEKGETKGKEIEVDQVFALNPELSVPEPIPIPTPITQPKRQITSAKNRISNVRPSSIPNNTPSPRQEESKKADDLENVPSARLNVVRSTNQNGNANPSPAGPVQNLQKQVAPAARRRSNVVKEVDRIKKQREERRAKQEEQKQQRSKDAELANHPNWEFIRMIRECQSDLNFQPLSNNDRVTVDTHQIIVCVRKRPMNKKEMSKKDIDVITIPHKSEVLVHEPKLKVDLTKYLENQHFRFDFALDENSTNEMVYRFTAKKLVESIFNKGMATCFAYGQTGSGKTHTMGGDFDGKKQDVTKGIYALSAHDVFKLLQKPDNRKKDLIIGCSFFEIYSGKVFDLLNKKSKLRVLEDGKQIVQVVGLKEEPVTSVEHVLKLIAHGNNVRTSGTTSANQHSSRSHAVFQIILRLRKNKKLHGKFSLIDLAGNERGKDTQSSNRQTRMEGAEINKSLLALKECIRSLSNKGVHVPFRASKLTQVLRDSFIADNAKTCMIATISPGMSSCEHTLNTLRYADRVKELGPSQPGNGEPNGTPLPSPNKSLSPSDSDLAMLCTHNEEEVSAEMYTFHEAMNQLHEIEEQVIDYHRTCVEESKQMLADEERLLEMTDEVDYDVEEYCTHLDDLLTRKIDMLSKLREKVNNFQRNLQEEETASKNIKRHPDS